MSVPCPHKVVNYFGDEFPEKHLWQTMTGRSVVNGKFNVPHGYDFYKDIYYNFETRKTDVFVNGTPKTGTTWIEEVVWTMLHNPNCEPQESLVHFRVISFDLDSYNISKHPTPPPVGIDPLCTRLMEKANKSKAIETPEGVKTPDWIKMAREADDPRVYKLHLALSLFKPDFLDNCKVVYCVRNPKDTIISGNSFLKTFAPTMYTGSLTEYMKLFIEGKLPFTNYWNQLRDAWVRRDHPNIHFVYFEDMKKDALGESRKIAKFLGLELTEEQFQKILHYTSFKEMSKREDAAMVRSKSDAFSDNTFFRKGVAGNWKENFTDDQVSKLDSWIKTESAKLEGFRDYTK